MPLTPQKRHNSFSSFQKLAVVCFAFFGMCLLCSEGCEIQQFDYRGYRCETNAHCLSGFVCDTAKNVCVVVKQEPKQVDSGSFEHKEASQAEKKLVERHSLLEASSELANAEASQRD